MNLTSLNNQLLDWLVEFQVKDLPNKPNINGIFNQSDITFAIISGSTADNPDFMTVQVNFSVAANLRKDNGETSINYTHIEESSLYSLVYELIYRIHKRKVSKGGLLRVTDFELFTPESGMWRGLVTAKVDIPLESAVDNNPVCLEILGV